MGTGYEGPTLFRTSQRLPGPQSLTHTHRLGQTRNNKYQSVVPLQQFSGHFILQMKKLELREVKEPAQSCTDTKWQTWGSYPGNLTPEPAAPKHSHSAIQATRAKVKDQRSDHLKAAKFCLGPWSPCTYHTLSGDRTSNMNTIRSQSGLYGPLPHYTPPPKIPPFRTSECDLICHKGLCRCNSGKNLKMRSPWIKVGPKSNNDYLTKRQQKRHRGKTMRQRLT